ncbi:hypothetical protein [Planctomicrobium piriforme]|uniref:REase AHJR-like domain-containing protein n=1 Tax=Planctomicrobium piriforme TaxID=1576369 RepID=A0A1I3SP46_9PLAN|nr:hypothetical protein [Planctomicrobium piriforme]SFJ59972.1 hypothetical protein SAMN05421753_12510 [Planctomicrobium piriforme]
MIQSMQQIYEARLREVAEWYQSRGYHVVTHPQMDEIPEFLAGFQPDLIAEKDSQRLVVELKIGTATSSIERFREIAQRVQSQPGWQLVVVYVPADSSTPLQIQDEIDDRMIQKRLDDARQLIAAQKFDAAYLLLWSAFEGLLRLVSQRQAIPVGAIPAKELLKELFSAGELGMREFDQAQKLLKVRNSIAHGFDAQDVRTSCAELEQLIENLLGQWHATVQVHA